MTPRRRADGSVFAIGSQHAKTITNVAGDMTYVHAPGSEVTVHGPRDEVDLLDRFLTAQPLPREVRRAAAVELRTLRRQLGTPQPDRGRMAGSLRRFTELLHDAGALTSAGAALVGPIGSLARWLGAAGVPILAMLGLG